jgi:hypothetical protein
MFGLARTLALPNGQFWDESLPQNRQLFALAAFAWLDSIASMSKLEKRLPLTRAASGTQAVG